MTYPESADQVRTQSIKVISEFVTNLQATLNSASAVSPDMHATDLISRLAIAGIYLVGPKGYIASTGIKK